VGDEHRAKPPFGGLAEIPAVGGGHLISGLLPLAVSLRRKAVALKTRLNLA
jgi:hypothetical protein